MDADNKGKSFGVGGYRGRIIFLGDGTEVLTDSDDTEMFDNADEDKDLESQVSKTSSTDNAAPQTAGEATSGTETKAGGDSALLDGQQPASSTIAHDGPKQDQSESSKENED